MARIKNLHFKWSKRQEKNRNIRTFSFIIFWNNMERGRPASFSHRSPIFANRFCGGVGMIWSSRRPLPDCIHTDHVHGGHRLQSFATSEQPTKGCLQSKAADKASLYDDGTVPRDCHEVTTR